MKALLFVLMLPCIPPDSVETLQAVTISAGSIEATQQSQNSVQVSGQYLQEHIAGSLVQSLEGVPGVKAQAIGTGLSKPTIRGLGYNRMVVSEDGIKHEGQQWGDDHGLEVDQFAVDAAEVIKGPATLQYGSDAIGGVISLAGNSIPTAPLEVRATLFGRSNNSQFGFSARVAGRRSGFFYKAVATASNYADYRVPAAEVLYFSYRIPLPNHRLRNTAGNERAARLLLGYTNNRNLRTDVTLSNMYASSGYFADAHGLEVRLSQIDYNRSVFDQDLPRQWVNHAKVQSHTTLQLGTASIEANLAWQNNRRCELSEPLSHGYMPTPPDSLERSYNKHTFSGTLVGRMPLGDRHEVALGAAAEHQRNRRAGWGFIIPDYNSTAAGIYATDRYTPTQHLTINGGMRYDIGSIAISPYYDWYLTPTAYDSVYKQRSASVERTFQSATWSVGANYHNGDWILRLNMGKAFRMPIAKELGADGINYHIFRYEQGNALLDPERAYQADAGVEWNHNSIAVKVDPYFSYFPNYIYLNPTPNYAEGLQLYAYCQAQAMRYGFEAEVGYMLCMHWEVGLRAQLCRSMQLSGDKRGYTLPFAVPPSVDADAVYHYHYHGCGKVGLNLHCVASQADIVPPESPTPAYATVNISASHRADISNGRLTVSAMVNNLLDTKYYDHTSYYRLMNLPEPGRNIALRLQYEFVNKANNKQL